MLLKSRSHTLNTSYPDHFLSYSYVGKDTTHRENGKDTTHRKWEGYYSQRKHSMFYFNNMKTAYKIICKFGHSMETKRNNTARKNRETSHS